MRVCELKQKEVINACDCKSLGCVFDVEFEECSGCIICIIVLGPPKICGIFGRDTEYVIPWKCICRIGPDIILVEVREDDVLRKVKI